MTREEILENKANLSGADLTEASLTKANLTKALLPPPTMVLLAYWGEVGEELTAGGY
jgi:hypothetical protein